MPELAEVEFFRKRWDHAARGRRVTAVRLHPHAKIFRGTSPSTLRHALTGAVLESSDAAAKQMLFRFSDEIWLGVHLGMSGELRVEPAGCPAGRHDHLVLDTAKHALVFNDPRMFGRVLLHRGAEPPVWWTKIAPPILSAAFTPAAVREFLHRRGRAPIKAVLLMQERFPGIGNWMADEILWRAGIHPRTAAGSLTEAQSKTLWREARHVCRMALDTIAGRGRSLPRDLNVNIPDTWLFHHRWQPGGRCPRTGVLLERAEIGGRTTCWSPARQPAPPRAPRPRPAARS
ncbi:Fpg/Nei family DNA glycosylase [Opitutus terrae]|uniref:DNA-formamidopyrimidine glycosylase n=1 Tax=Opitutus terrae (strain DSM 11246 / JCM 15787 / PB90-1) TaxID=452637 RepID=B1ZQP2_OPITP|nr:DNA-formamidopyrimidine glycosylase family protein [Opitutus terrae]ACB75654.1 DNA-formamidopyrimidine glycosylase [Opitutus terrae PB90-1]